MSVAAYEPRNFIHDGNYPAIGEPQEVQPVHEVHDLHEVQSVHSVPDVPQSDPSRFDDNDVATELAAAVGGYTAQSPIMAEPEPIDPEPVVDPVDHVEAAAPAVGTPPSPAVSVVPKASTTSPAPAGGPQRVKAIPKPERAPTKDLDGKYVCTWPNCKEEMKAFTRRCEWSKHMDKHDRPYKCTAEGCEKLPGFTYSGGLLRHEREVHDKHGGPKNPLHCPHPTCKRHTGKGFSRQENLNEHLRRVHTNGVTPTTPVGPALNAAGGDSDEAGSDTGAAAGAAAATAAVGLVGVGANANTNGTTSSSGKRKRATSSADDRQDLREEVKRLRLENEELSRQVEAQNRQTAIMIQQIAELQEALQPRRETLA